MTASGGRIIAASVTNSQIQLLFETTNGWRYQVQSSPSFQSRYWADQLSPIHASNSIGSFSGSLQEPYGFYRVLEFSERVFWYDWTYYKETPSLEIWGLGAFESGYRQVDRGYDWYIDQADTGEHSNDNCGPSSVTMGIKWYSQGFNGTAADARNAYRPTGGWWSTRDIINYLNLNSVPNTTSTFIGADQLVGLLDQGKIMILCINTGYLSRNYEGEQRVGRFYGFAGGHFLVVKGWRSTANGLFFEVYDPNNWHAQYEDSTPKGRNRHLLASDLAQSIINWWRYLIVIHPSAAAGGGSAVSGWLRIVDPTQIPHMSGR